MPRNEHTTTDAIHDSNLSRQHAVGPPHSSHVVLAAPPRTLTAHQGDLAANIDYQDHHQAGDTSFHPLPVLPPHHATHIPFTISSHIPTRCRITIPSFHTALHHHSDESKPVRTHQCKFKFLFYSTTHENPSAFQEARTLIRMVQGVPVHMHMFILRATPLTPLFFFSSHSLIYLMQALQHIATSMQVFWTSRSSMQLFY